MNPYEGILDELRIYTGVPTQEKINWLHREPYVMFNTSTRLVFANIGKMCLEIEVMLPKMEAVILSSDIEMTDKRPTLEVEEIPCL